MVTDVINGTEEHLHQICQIQEYENKYRLSYAGNFYYTENLNWASLNLRLGRMRPKSRWLDIAGL